MFTSTIISSPGGGEAPSQASNPPDLLRKHLEATLGAWPPRSHSDLVIWHGRDIPGWDGKSSPGLGMESPEGTLLSVSPHIVDRDRDLPHAEIFAALKHPNAGILLPEAFDRRDLLFGRAVFRWGNHIPDLPEVGVWTDAGDARLPQWLRPFNGGVLAAFDHDGTVKAAVGIKRHNAFGREIAVETHPAHRGRGLASMLVAQAARKIIRDGAIPLYLHELHNPGSAIVAERAGFPDKGWRMIGLYPSLNSPMNFRHESLAA